MIVLVIITGVLIYLKPLFEVVTFFGPPEVAPVPVVGNPCYTLTYLFRNGFGSACGKPNYDSRADFDKNGKINITDFSLFRVNYEKPNWCSEKLNDLTNPCLSPFGAGSDLDLVYIRRTPEYEWSAAKNWPDVDERVTFTAHIINKGSAVAPPFSYHWQMFDPQENLINEGRGSYTNNVNPNQEVTVSFNWQWRDGPNKLKFKVDPENLILESYEQNNELEEYTNAYLAAFQVEKTLYDWFNSTTSCQDAPPDYFVWADGLVKPGYRCGTKSWEDWTQRQIKQMNEWFRKAETDWLDNEEHSLPRVKINRLDVVADDSMYEAGGVLRHNCPYRTTGEQKLYDTSWGFETIAWSQNCGWEFVGDECYEGHPRSIAWYSHRPEWLTVERAAIHELGHTFNRPHLDVGRLENTWKYGQIYCQVRVEDDQGNYALQPFKPDSDWDPAHKCYEGIIYSCDQRDICPEQGYVMQSPEAAGWSRYNALGMRYQLGYRFRPGITRELPTRIGHWNGCEYDITAVPILLSERQIPSSNKLKVIDKNNNPVPGVDVFVYFSRPEYAYWPLIDNTPDIAATTDWQGIINLGRYPLGGPEVSYPFLGRSMVIQILKEGESYWRFLDVMHLNLAFWQGQTEGVYIVDLKQDGTHQGIE